MPEKSTQVSLAGLCQNSNQLALPPGSCSQADNVTMRSPGTFEPMRRTVAQVSTTNAWDYVKANYLKGLERILEVARLPGSPDISVELTGGTTLTGALNVVSAPGVGSWAQTQLTTIVNAATSPTSTRPLGFLSARTQSEFHKSRAYLCEKWGVLTFDNTATTLDLRFAGLLAPVVLTPSLVTSGTDLWLVSTNSVKYRAVFTEETSDGIVRFSGVSSGVVLRNNAGAPASSVLNIGVATKEPYARYTAGTLYVRLYRTSQAVVTDSSELVEDFRQVFKAQISSAQFTSGTIVVSDGCSEDSRDSGEPLYTNEGEEGALQVNYPPPASNDCVAFQDTMFYANRVAWPTVTLTPKAEVGFVGITGIRARGVGIRNFNGGVTGTGAVSITGVSAGDLVGLTVGQRVTGSGTVSGIPNFPIVSATIVDIIGTTVFIDRAAFATPDSNPINLLSFDQVKVYGYYQDATQFYGQADITSPQTLPISAPLPATSPTFGVPAPIPGFRAEHPGVDTTTFSTGWTCTISYLGQYLNLICGATSPVKTESNFFVRVTNPQNYVPTIVNVFTGFTNLNTAYPNEIQSITDRKPNRLFFSKTGQPEAVPPSNYLDVGNGTIYKMWRTQNALLVYCSDGLYKVTGNGSDWTVTQVDPTALLVHPDCVTSLNNQCYAWLTTGMATVGEEGQNVISTEAIGPNIRRISDTFRKVSGAASWGPAMTGDQFYNEVWLNVRQFDIASWVFNTDSKAFTTQTAVQFKGLCYADSIARNVYITPQDVSNTQSTVVQTDYLLDAASQRFFPAKVFLNPFVTAEAGNLKQWIDVNWFLFLTPDTTSVTSSPVQGIFDGVTGLTSNIRQVTAIGRDLHFWVPRRSVLADQLNVGLLTFSSSAPADAPFFRLFGLTIRSRVASDTFVK